MRLLNVTTVNLFPFLKKFAPSQSGKMGYELTHNGDIEIFALEQCDCCDVEVRGANPVTIVKPKASVVLNIIRMVEAYGIPSSKVLDEGGCDDDGNFVCPACYCMNDNDKSGVCEAV